MSTLDVRFEHSTRAAAEHVARAVDAELRAEPGKRQLRLGDAMREAGVEAAVAAGMRCIGVGSPNQLSKANKVITTTGDFQPEELATL